MDNWSNERNECRKRFQDKAKRGRKCSIHTLVFSCMMTLTCLLSFILLSSKVFISKFYLFVLFEFFSLFLGFLCLAFSPFYSPFSS